MSLTPPLVSDRFPYLPLTLTVRGAVFTCTALLDTGFDGAIIVPEGFFPPSLRPSRDLLWTLADGSPILAPSWWGTAQLGTLPAIGATIVALGNEFLIGRRVSDRYRIVLDRGQHLTVEP